MTGGRRKWLRRSAATLGAAFIVAQFVPVARTNPPVDPAKTITKIEHVPLNVEAVFDRSCADCHSDRTRWPWYSYVAPVSWVVAHDVHEARHRFNFSQWGTYSAAKRDHELEEICNEVLGGDMPDGKYTLLHRTAQLTADDRAAICEWTGSPRQ